MSPAELATVVASARQRDEAALERLVDAYSSRLYGFLYRLTSSRDEAEDLVQEVFVRVIRTIDQYHEDGRFEAWLFRIAVNLARDRVRRLKRQPDISSLDQAGSSEPPIRDRLGIAGSSPAEDREEQAEQVVMLQQALDRLPEPEREVIVLRHYSKLSFADIAELMGTPLGTALARAHRGLRKLRADLEGGTS
jgi:RNA polymerase sigma factor (sigma-70 family)